MKFKTLIAAATFGFAAATAQAATIDTTTVWDSFGSLSSFGVNATRTYGETFIAPQDQMNSFTFYVNTYGTNFTVTAQVYAWSGALGGHGPAVGSPLFSQNVSFNNDGLGAVTVNTGGIALSTGSQYVALFTADPGLGAVGSSSSWGFNFFPSGVANDGNVVWYNNNSVADLTVGSWDGPWIEGSLAWIGEFSDSGHQGGGNVPEPATLTLVAAGLIALGVRRRKAA